MHHLICSCQLILYYFSDYSSKLNENQDDFLSDERIVEIIKNVQNRPATYSKVRMSFNYYKMSFLDLL